VTNKGKKYIKPVRDIKKTRFLEALEKSAGLFNLACRKAGVPCSTIRKWLEVDPVFKEKYQEILEYQNDMIESKLLKKIQEDDTTMIIFYAKTKLKHRGYSERAELDLTSKGESIKPDKEFTLNIVRTVYNSDTEIKPCSIQES
jgi:hypothetical protein